MMKLPRFKKWFAAEAPQHKIRQIVLGYQPCQCPTNTLCRKCWLWTFQIGNWKLSQETLYVMLLKYLSKELTSVKIDSGAYFLWSLRQLVASEIELVLKLFFKSSKKSTLHDFWTFWAIQTDHKTFVLRGRGPLYKRRLYGGAYLAKPDSAKSETAVQETDKTESGKPESDKPNSGIC